MTDNILMSSIPLKNDAQSNGTFKNNTFSPEISISEPVIDNTNSSFHSMKKEKVHSKQINSYTTWEKIYLPATLIILMCMIAIILQIPTVLYYSDPPSAEPVLLDNINLETCSIDNPELLNSSFNTTLKMLCSDTYSFNTDANFVTARAPVLECPDDFGIFCGSVCQPLCDEVSLFNDVATYASKVLNIIFHTISLIGGVVTLIACCLRKRNMFSFPLIFVVYNTIILTVISLFMLLPYIFGSGNLLCSHSNLIVSNAKSTIFCQIQGLVSQTGSMIFFGFWLCHLSYILFSLKYPFKAEELMKSNHLRNIHVLEVVITLVCALLPSIIIISTSGYKHSGFPPLCTHKIPEMLFYTFILPISIGATFGLFMLLLSIVILRKHHYMKDRTMSSRRPSMREMIFTSYSVPEAKLVILFSYYGITILLLLIDLTVTLHSRDTTAENITNLTVCSAGGYRTECNKYRETLNSNLTPAVVFELISTLFFSFANVVNLLYVLQCNDLKVFKCKCRASKAK